MLSSHLSKAEEVLLANTFSALVGADGKTLHFSEDCWVDRDSLHHEEVSMWSDLSWCGECENYTYSDLQGELRNFREVLDRLIALEEGLPQASLRAAGELTAKCADFKDGHDYIRTINKGVYLPEASMLVLDELAAHAMSSLKALFNRPCAESDKTWVGIPLFYLKTYSSATSPSPVNQFFDQEIGRIRALSDTHAIFAGDPAEFDVAEVPSDLVASVSASPTPETIRAMLVFLEDGLEFSDATRMAYSV